MVGCSRLPFSGRLSVEFTCNRVPDLGEVFVGGFYGFDVFPFQSFFDLIDRFGDLGFCILIDFVTHFLELLLGLMHLLLCLVLCFYRFAFLFVFGGVGLGIVHHFLNLGIRKTG